MNIILKPFNCCPECLNLNLITDLERLEVYCSNCGLVVKDNEFLTIEQSIKQEQLLKQKLEELKQIKQLAKPIEIYENQQLKAVRTFNI